MERAWRKNAGRIFLVAVIAIMTVCTASCGVANNPQSLEEMIKQTAAGLEKVSKDTEIAPAGSSTGDWIAMTLAFAGNTAVSDNYLQKLEAYIIQQYDEKGGLSTVKATEYQRAGLTMLALGGNPTDIEDKGNAINLVADGTWNFSGGSPGMQGANGLVYALLLLDSGQYGDAEVRAQYVSELLTYQKDSGAFCIDNSLDGDVDMTAMALQALAPYREETKEPDVKTAVDSAYSWLSAQSAVGESAESSAQTILALCALGENPMDSSFFDENGQTLVQMLNTYRMKNGMYKHESDDEKENIMATYQSLLALEAIQKLETENRWIFDFTD